MLVIVVFFQAEDGIRAAHVTGVQTCALPIYIPYADSVADATNVLAEQAPELIEVNWSDNALLCAQSHSDRLHADVVALIEQCLAQDPKPAYQQPSPDRVYGVRLWDLNVTWCYPSSTEIKVLGVINEANTPTA